MKKEELTRQIVAVDERKQTYTINEFTEYVLAETFNQSEWEEGLHRFALEDGSAVNPAGDSLFQVVESGLVLREVDLPT
jgi:hypothetical protein